MRRTGGDATSPKLKTLLNLGRHFASHHNIGDCEASTGFKHPEGFSKNASFVHHGRWALVSVSDHYYRLIFSGDHLHHGPLGPIACIEILGGLHHYYVRVEVLPKHRHYPQRFCWRSLCPPQCPCGQWFLRQPSRVQLLAALSMGFLEGRKLRV